jgi:hypothetical protein
MSRSTLEPDLSFRPDLIAGVWEAVAYADLFDYPLTHDELFAFLPVRATRARVDATVEPLSARGDWLATDGEYVYFRHRPELPRIRKARAVSAKRAWIRARRYGRVVWSLPCVRMVAVTGALAMDNVVPGDDIDLLIVTEPGTVWTVRGMVILLCRFARVFGDTLCPNFVLSSGALILRDRTQYAAHELAQMVVMHGSETATRLWNSNSWCGDFLPNAKCPRSDDRADALPYPLRLAKLAGEFLLGTSAGRRLELWEQGRKIARLAALVPTDNTEAVYTAEVCKGHDRGHGRRIMSMLSTRTGEDGA